MCAGVQSRRALLGSMPPAPSNRRQTVHRYKVIASNPETAVVAVEDAEGRCHLGRALVAPPPPGADLHGEPPAFGVRSLKVCGVDEPCPVVLVLLDCKSEAAARLLTI
jgi:hypothetical protein